MLTSINLANNPISADRVADLARAVTTNHTLSTLILTGADGEDEGAAAIALMLRTNRTLTHLCLSNNKFSDEGAAAIGSALTANSSLTLLKCVVW